MLCKRSRVALATQNMSDEELREKAAEGDRLAAGFLLRRECMPFA